MTKKNDLWAQLVIDPKKLKNLKWDFSQIIWEPLALGGGSPIKGLDWMGRVMEEEI
jgi:hypothetical protein